MTKKLEYKMDLNAQIYNEYFGGVPQRDEQKAQIGIVNGRSAHYLFDFEKIIISYDDADECEIYYFYPEEADRLLSHYTIFGNGDKSLKVLTSLISLAEDGNFLLDTCKADYVRDVNRYEDDISMERCAPYPLGFDDIYTTDIIGCDAFELDERITGLPSIYNTSLETEETHTSDRLFGIHDMRMLEGTYSKVRQRN